MNIIFDELGVHQTTNEYFFVNNSDSKLQLFNYIMIYDS